MAVICDYNLLANDAMGLFKQGSGMRVGKRSHGGVLPWGADSLYRAEGAAAKHPSAPSASREGDGGEKG